MPKTTDFPSPDRLHPITLPDGAAHQGVVFLSAAIRHPRMSIGAYTYASAHVPPKDWAAYLAPYLYDFSPERLIIGKFCQIADGVQFITASANHRHDGVSSYPFAIFGGTPGSDRPSMPGPGRDTVVGHDVWIGQDAKLLPSARLGHGVIVGAGAVVGGQIPDYAVIAGNPARVIRHRFAPDVAARLVRMSWWDWTIPEILAREALISGGDVDALERSSPQNT